MSDTETHHREILAAIQAHAPRREENGNHYIGTAKPCYAMSMPVARQIAREWIACHPELTAAEYRRLLDSLSRGESSNEIGLIGDFLLLLPRFRKTIGPRQVERWVGRAVGWGEVDSICQGKFTADELLSNWPA